MLLNMYKNTFVGLFFLVVSCAGSPVLESITPDDGSVEVLQEAKQLTVAVESLVNFLNNANDIRRSALGQVVQLSLAIFAISSCIASIFAWYKVRRASAWVRKQLV